jgi:hypothetical protein
MSRTETRARQRRRRIEQGLQEAVIAARTADAQAAQDPALTPGHGALWRLLQDVNRSDLRVWDLVRMLPLTEEERQMIAQAVNPQLAGLTPGNIHHRHKLGDERLAG